MSACCVNSSAFSSTPPGPGTSTRVRIWRLPRVTSLTSRRRSVLLPAPVTRRRQLPLVTSMLLLTGIDRQRRLQGHR